MKCKLRSCKPSIRKKLKNPRPSRANRGNKSLNNFSLNARLRSKDNFRHRSKRTVRDRIMTQRAMMKKLRSRKRRQRKMEISLTRLEKDCKTSKKRLLDQKKQITKNNFKMLKKNIFINKWKRPKNRGKSELSWTWRTRSPAPPKRSYLHYLSSITNKTPVQSSKAP